MTPDKKESRPAGNRTAIGNQQDGESSPKNSGLRIPDHLPGDPIRAAIAYAEAGWYVLPVNQATKHAGSVLGVGWPGKSSKDPEQIVDWFAGTDYGLALHVGRSGAVAFDVDVDQPNLLPAAAEPAKRRAS